MTKQDAKSGSQMGDRNSQFQNALNQLDSAKGAKPRIALREENDRVFEDPLEGATTLFRDTEIQALVSSR